MKFEYKELTNKTLNTTRSPMQFDDIPLAHYSYKANGWHVVITGGISGVQVMGVTPPLKTQEDLDALYRVIQWAHRHHLSLKTTHKLLDQDELSKELIA